MKNYRKYAPLFVLSLAMALLLTLLVFMGTGSARPVALEDAPPNVQPSLSASGGARVAGSSVTTAQCYTSNKTQTLCFTIYNGSIDGEWLDLVRLTFPNFMGLGPWNVSCFYQDMVDSSGNPVKLTCEKTKANEVIYDDRDVETPSIGEISAGSSWQVCVNMDIPAGYNGPRLVLWGLSGDEEPGSGQPHEIADALEVEECGPLMLEPESRMVEGCNGISQVHEVSLWNNTGSSGDFNLFYEVPSNNAEFAGPPSFTLGAGWLVTFTVDLQPSLFLKPGDQVTAELIVEGNMADDGAVFHHEVTDFAGWESRQGSPKPSMDNVVVWASHADGGLWVIGGYGSTGATQRYDPETNTWTVHTPESVITPTIEYPMDGCYGLNGGGEEIVVLFPDTILTGTLHIYNITQDTWYTETVPAFYPPEGRWAQDIVSLLNYPGEIPEQDKNVCYLTGGSTQEGGGRTRDLWVYYPATNSGDYLGNYPAENWFNFHAAWYVPWVGNQGSICVAGGIDHKSQINASTQCYDLDTSSFRVENADLGPIPEPWWGMADGWQIHEGHYQIWMANGVAQDGTLLPASAYADATTGVFVPGPDLPTSLYRLEGDGWNGQFFTVGGAAGGFNHTTNNQLLTRCPITYPGHLPLLVRNNRVPGRIGR